MELRYQKKSCSECQQDVRKQYFSMSICHEELHTQFVRRMVTKVVVAITWLQVGIGWPQRQF